MSPAGPGDVFGEVALESADGARDRCRVSVTA
ncbi:hypothetical protein N566_18870 [Streptomycetaceae bacterium MP113-05]|nr:hypothetical protein N566_18870 [Streptomycetaceae bacterium MP113-05]